MGYPLCLFMFLLMTINAIADDDRVRVFVLAGQSNMEGQGVVDLDHPQYYNGGKGNLIWSMSNGSSKQMMRHLRNSDGVWAERSDVLVRYQTAHGLKKGALGIGYTAYPGKHHIGPELQFGHILGDHLDEPILLIKTCWGGKSLFKDFRPPGAGGVTGDFYRKMIQDVEHALKVFPSEFPSLAGKRCEMSGMVWFQGWNDMFNEQSRLEYADNLIHLVDDFREHFNVPTLPVLIVETGNLGEQASENMFEIRRAQKAAAKHFGPRGKVVFVKTSAFARPKEFSPNIGHGHHWFGNAESYFLIGDAMGRGMLPLLQ